MRPEEPAQAWGPACTALSVLALFSELIIPALTHRSIECRRFAAGCLINLKKLMPALLKREEGAQLSNGDSRPFGGACEKVHAA